MKKIELTKGIQIIVIIVFIILLGLIIVLNVSNNQVNASCSACAYGYSHAITKTKNNGYHGWYYYCPSCGGTGSEYETGPCSGTTTCSNCSYCAGGRILFSFWRKQWWI